MSPGERDASFAFCNRLAVKTVGSAFFRGIPGLKGLAGTTLFFHFPPPPLLPFSAPVFSSSRTRGTRFNHYIFPPPAPHHSFPSYFFFSLASLLPSFLSSRFNKTQHLFLLAIFHVITRHFGAAIKISTHLFISLSIFTTFTIFISFHFPPFPSQPRVPIFHHTSLLIYPFLPPHLDPFQTPAPRPDPLLPVGKWWSEKIFF